MTHSFELTNAAPPAQWKARLPWVLAVIVIVIQLLAAILLPKSVSWDPSYGLLAAQHYVGGQSPDLVHFRMADPSDLSKDMLFDPGYWAPGYQVIPWLVRFGTHSWGGALQVTVALSLLVGFAGWGFYFKRALDDVALAGWLLLAVACSRYSWVYTVVYQGGDLLLWVAASWLLLANLFALQHVRPPLCFVWTIVAGLAASGVFLLKYSGAFLSAGLGLVWAWSWWKNRVSLVRVALWATSAFLGFAVIRMMGFPSHHNPGATRFGWLIIEAIGSLGLVASGPTDFESLAAKALDVVSLSGTEWHVGIVGFLLLLAALLAIVLGLREKGRSQVPGELTSSHVVRTAGVFLGLTDIFALAALYSIGGNLGPQARLGRVAGLFLLPAAFLLLRSAANSVRNPTRWLARSVILIAVILPAVYGVVAGVPKLIQGWRYRLTSVGPDGVACFYLKPGTSHSAFFGEVEAALPDEQTLLVVAHPQSAFPLAKRRFVVFDGLEALTLDQLKQTKFAGVPLGGVALLVHRSPEEDVRSEIVRRAFVDVGSWRSKPLAADPEWMLWLAETK